MTKRKEASATDERYIDVAELRQLIPVTDMTIWRWIRDPIVAFPPPVKLGPNGRNFWWLPKIREFQRRRENAQAASPAPRQGDPAGSTAAP
jgi:predicted DNA-binding transcriptional regulator AlpA